MGTFGETLRKEREKRGITLESVSDGTKIGTRFLQALEAEQFDQLPGGVFNRGFVRAYAKHIGIDEEKAVADYLAASGQTPAASSESSTGQPGADGSKPPRPPAADAIRITETSPARFENVSDFVRRMPWTELATILLLAVAIVAGWRYVKHRGQATSAPPAIPRPAVVPTPAPAPPAPVPVKAKAPPPPATSSLQLLIHADEDCWLSVTTDGVAQGEIMLLAGEAKTLQADREILMKAGNAGGLTFALNGIKLPSQGDEGEVVTLDFDRSGVKKIPTQSAPADPLH